MSRSAYVNKQSAEGNIYTSCWRLVARWSKNDWSSEHCCIMMTIVEVLSPEVLPKGEDLQFLKTGHGTEAKAACTFYKQ